MLYSTEAQARSLCQWAIDMGIPQLPRGHAPKASSDKSVGSRPSGVINSST